MKAPIGIQSECYDGDLDFASALACAAPSERDRIAKLQNKIVPGLQGLFRIGLDAEGHIESLRFQPDDALLEAYPLLEKAGIRKSLFIHGKRFSREFRGEQLQLILNAEDNAVPLASDPHAFDRDIQKAMLPMAKRFEHYAGSLPLSEALSSPLLSAEDRSLLVKATDRHISPPYQDLWMAHLVERDGKAELVGIEISPHVAVVRVSNHLLAPVVEASEARRPEGSKKRDAYLAAGCPFHEQSVMIEREALETIARGESVVAPGFAAIAAADSSAREARQR